MEGGAGPMSCDRVTNSAGVFAELSLYARVLKTFSFLAFGSVTLSQGSRGKKAKAQEQLERDSSIVSPATSVREVIL